MRQVNMPARSIGVEKRYLGDNSADRAVFEWRRKRNARPYKNWPTGDSVTVDCRDRARMSDRCFPVVSMTIRIDEIACCNFAVSERS